MNDPYRIFPPPVRERHAELFTSIETVGMKNPPVVDEHGYVIDGHERRDICAALGRDWLAGADVRTGLSDIQKKALAIELNLWRRPIHLTREQRNELVDIYLIANPHLSEPQVAELFGVAQSTVNRRRKSLMQSHKLSQVTATVGKDGVTRRIGDRRKQPARILVRGKTEFEKLQPALALVGDDLHGIVRRPKLIRDLALRKAKITKVNSGPHSSLPSNVRIEHCDFRDLQIEQASIDVVLTDVVWSLDALPDWIALAKLARRWLRGDGLLCSLIGTGTLAHFLHAVMRYLHPQWTMEVRLSQGRRNLTQNIRQGWLPVAIFSRVERSPRLCDLDDSVPAPAEIEKDYHDWQQSLPVAIELMSRLTRPGDRICDPQIGTGTNAVACLRLVLQR